MLSICYEVVVNDFNNCFNAMVEVILLETLFGVCRCCNIASWTFCESVCGREESILPVLLHH